MDETKEKEPTWAEKLRRGIREDEETKKLVESGLSLYAGLNLFAAVVGLITLGVFCYLLYVFFQLAF